MSDYTPREEEIVSGFVPLGNGLVRSIHEDETERGIAKVKADAVREAAKQFWNPRGESTDDDAKRILNRIASRIEEGRG